MSDNQLDSNLFYHGIHHTFDDVLPNSIRIIQEMSHLLTEEDTLIVKTVIALYHDTGFLDQYDKNEPKGCERATESFIWIRLFTVAD